MDTLPSLSCVVMPLSPTSFIALFGWDGAAWGCPEHLTFLCVPSTMVSGHGVCQVFFGRCR